MVWEQATHKRAIAQAFEKTPGDLARPASEMMSMATQSLQLSFFGFSASASGDTAVLYLTIIALVLVVCTVLVRVLRKRE
jgi:hypothetical protein